MKNSTSAKVQSKREPMSCDRPCDSCGQPMIGIMKDSDKNGYKSPRKICVHCEAK